MPRDPVESHRHALRTAALGDVDVRIVRFGLDESRPIVAIVVGAIAGAPPLVRLHSRCFYGEILGSLDCDCLAQLELAWERFREEGRGVLLYLEQEGRGSGLLSKARAYELQQLRGVDTVDAYREMHLPVDSRDYRDAANVLSLMGIESLRLMTNNSRKTDALVQAGLKVERVRHQTRPTRWNVDYLRVKQEKLGHDLGLTAEERT